MFSDIELIHSPSGKNNITKINEMVDFIKCLTNKLTLRYSAVVLNVSSLIWSQVAERLGNQDSNLKVGSSIPGCAK